MQRGLTSIKKLEKEQQKNPSKYKDGNKHNNRNK